MANNKDSELRIVLLGKTGSGKSSSGNTILKENIFGVNSNFQEGTKESVRVYRSVNDRTVWVIDTPGVFGVTSKDEVKEQLEEAVDLVYPGVHAFLLVMRVDVRFTEEEQNTVKWIVENFGEEIQKHIIVLFTHGNLLGERSIEEYLDGSPELKGVVNSVAGCHVFENENEDDETQVTELLEKINRVMNTNEKKKIYTKEMYRKVQRKKQLHKCIEYAGITGVVGAAAVGVAAAAKGGHSVIAGAAAAAAAMGAIAWARGKKHN